MPKVNLIRNIGFGPDATFGKNTNDPMSSLPTYPLPAPLIHPVSIEANEALDAFTYAHIFNVTLTKSLLNSMSTRLRTHFPRAHKGLKSVRKVIQR
jgi:hypothetical protein